MKKILLMTALTLPCGMAMAEEAVQTTAEVDGSPIKSVTIETPADLKPVQVKVYPSSAYQSVKVTEKVEAVAAPVEETQEKPCRAVKAVIEIQCPECDFCTPPVATKIEVKVPEPPKCEPCEQAAQVKAEPVKEAVKEEPVKEVVKEPEPEQKAKPKPAPKKKAAAKKKKKVSLKKKFAWKKPTNRPKIMPKPSFAEPEVVKLIEPPAPIPEALEPSKAPVEVEVQEEVIKEIPVIPVITEQAKTVTPITPAKVRPVGDLEVSLNKVLGGMDLQTRLEGLKEVKAFAEYDKECHERIECMLEKFLRKRAAKNADGVMQVQECGTDIEAALYVLGIVRNPSNPLNLSDLDFSNIMIKADTLEGANFANSSFTGSTIKGSVLKKADFTNADFVKTFFLNVDMQKSVLDKAVFASANLNNVDFTEATLNGVTFKRAKISNSVFAKASLADTLFVDAVIKDTSFALANLGGANFSRAILVKDRFNGANLTSADFYQAQIEKVKFYDAILKDANAKDTDFQDTEGMTVDMFLTALTDSNTVVPKMIDTTYNQVRVKEASYSTCSAKECQTRLKGFENYLPELLDNSLRVLSGAHETVGNRAWALCNIKCVLHADGSRSDFAVGEVADFVRKRAPWPPRNNRRAAATAPDIDVQAAIYVIGSRPKEAMSTTVDLTNTDLRGADFYGMDMSGVDWHGSNLRGALVTNSKGLPPDLSSTIVRK
ncbi:MAG: pentapeptide repeat-containing protein [Alphaproteobacteria bacterium]|nr:pentapeptide repeat-containing protein [Alphaproteobacteria bacterium]